MTLAWATRDVEVALMFIGQMGCEAANFVLKRLIREERPRGRISPGKGYGMPSSHAQFVAFWAVSIVLFLLLRHGPHENDGRGKAQGRRGLLSQRMASDSPRADGGSGAQKRGRRGPAGGSDSAAGSVVALPQATVHPPMSVAYPLRVIACLVALTLAAAVSGSRLYLNYHTPKQVLVGVAAGISCALAWFAATELARRKGLLRWILGTGVVRWFRIRDLAVHEDLWVAGWLRWEALREADEAAEREEREQAGGEDEDAVNAGNGTLEGSDGVTAHPGAVRHQGARAIKKKLV